MNCRRVRTMKIGLCLVLWLGFMNTFSVGAMHEDEHLSGEFSVSYIATAPEIDLQGNGLSITAGDTTPWTMDHTDFGEVDVSSGHVDHTFRIRNLGDATLNLTNAPPIMKFGDHHSDFNVVAGGDDFTIAPGGYEDFTIRFDPSDLGLRSATITIGNDDSDEDPYNFAIQGTGAYPEMDVYGNNVEIADGDTTPSMLDHTDFGPVLVDGGSVDRTFRIWNHGVGTLNYTYAPPIFVIPNTQFNIVAGGNDSSLPPGEYEDFTVRFNPSGTGIYSATIQMGNNDSDEDPYNFTIQGWGAHPMVYLPLALR